MIRDLAQATSDAYFAFLKMWQAMNEVFFKATLTDEGYKVIMDINDVENSVMGTLKQSIDDALEGAGI